MVYYDRVELVDQLDSGFSIQTSRARFYCEIKTENLFTH